MSTPLLSELKIEVPCAVAPAVISLPDWVTFLKPRSSGVVPGNPLSEI